MITVQYRLAEQIATMRLTLFGVESLVHEDLAIDGPNEASEQFARDLREAGNKLHEAQKLLLKHQAMLVKG